MSEGAMAESWIEFWACNHTWQRIDAGNPYLRETVKDAARALAFGDEGMDINEYVIVCPSCDGTPVDVSMTMREVEINSGQTRDIDLGQRFAWRKSGLKQGIEWMRRMAAEGNLTGQVLADHMAELRYDEAEYLAYYGEEA